MVTQTPPQKQEQEMPATPALIQAVLAGLTMHYGEPLVDPQRIVYSIPRSLVEAGANRPLQFKYVVDELNPFGRVDIILPEGM